MKRLDVLLLEARGDVASKRRTDVNQESAWRWAALAIAAWEIGKVADAVDYYHEAVEHAAHCDSSGENLRQVCAWVRVHVPAGVL